MITMKSKRQLVEKFETLTLAEPLPRMSRIYGSRAEFNQDFMAGFYDEIYRILDCGLDTHSIQREYLSFRKDLEQLKRVKHSSKSEWKRLVGGKNACAFALDWQTAQLCNQEPSTRRGSSRRI
jgi:hypothetical protein